MADNYPENTETVLYIHTRCIGYDLFDGSDWDNYIVLEIVRD